MLYTSECVLKRNTSIMLFPTFLIRYIYLEEMEEDILQEEVVAFLELGEQYQVEKLKELAEEKMLQLLDKENMVKFLVAGDLFR